MQTCNQEKHVWCVEERTGGKEKKGCVRNDNDRDLKFSLFGSFLIITYKPWENISLDTIQEQQANATCISKIVIKFLEGMEGIMKRIHKFVTESEKHKLKVSFFSSSNTNSNTHTSNTSVWI